MEPHRQFPTCFLLFAVAKLGGQYRQVAVARYHVEHPLAQGFRGVDSVWACIRAMTTFADPANRTAIQGELALADAAYAKNALAPPRLDLRNTTTEPVGHPLFDREQVKWWWNTQMVEFPFISTCLLLSIRCAGVAPCFASTVSPLGLVFNDRAVEYGMVVVDISDLDCIKYGIVAFSTEEPLSARSYVEKYAYDFEEVRRNLKYGRGHEFDVLQLEKYPVVDLDALEVAWPPDPSPSNEDRQDDKDSTENPSRQAGRSSPRSLLEQRVSVLVHHPVEAPDAMDGGNKDGTLFGEDIQNIPDFPTALRSQLRQNAQKLHQSPCAAELLRIAYEGQEHLDWVSFSHLSPEVIGAVLHSNGLRNARSISLCIDQINGTPAALISALAMHTPPFDSIYLHQTPTRETDHPTAALLTDPTFNTLLTPTTRLFLTGIFSAALRRTILLPPTFTPPSLPFPIQHLFIRTPNINYDDGALAPPPTSHWPEYFYLGDTPFCPERFAAGFLAILHALGKAPEADEHDTTSLLEATLCCAPPALDAAGEFFVDERDKQAAVAQRVEIAPLPCENRSVPFLAARCGVPREVVFKGECWPLVRAPLAPEAGWSVVVDVGRWGEGEGVVRYAFVKGVEGGGVRVVGGLREFLEEAAPGVVEEGLVERRMEELERAAVKKWAPRERERWVEVLGDEEAREMLDEFLADAGTFGRSMLRVAMLARPEEKRWYPELLEGEGVVEETQRFLEDKLPRTSKTLSGYTPDDELAGWNDSDSEDGDASYHSEHSVDAENSDDLDHSDDSLPDWAQGLDDSYFAPPFHKPGSVACMLYNYPH